MVLILAARSGGSDGVGRDGAGGEHVFDPIVDLCCRRVFPIPDGRPENTAIGVGTDCKGDSAWNARRDIRATNS